MTQIINKFSQTPPQRATIVDILRDRSLKMPHTQAFTFLEDGETIELTLTYQELDRRSRAVGAQLQALGLSGERAILLYPPGLDYLIAFFGCLYAGVVAVPAYPPRNQRNTPRIQAITIDAQASIALTTTAMLPALQSIVIPQTKQGNFRWLTTDNIAQGLEDSWKQSAINGDTLAFLQYTSGSTGTPKGVMLTHGNLLHNAAVTYQMMEHSPNSKFVSWLPVYHDMGLIGGILQPLYGGFGCILMSPAAFLQRPYRWLQAISRYKGTTSGGPNFAYQQCIQRITSQQKETLDLSSWSVAFNGAEPVRQETLEQFATTFAECGFRPEAFYPCYGMAEATLIVSGGSKTALAQVKTVEKSALSHNQIVEATTHQDIQSFVSCGKAIPQQEIVIVNPELTRCSSDEVGEIWVSGPCVGQGYWNRTEETKETFHAYLKDTGEGPFLRTGDLGFLHNRELFITGRVKDLIIIRGRNIYPQDIELSAQRSHSSLRSGANAAFTVEVNNEERLVLVQELEFRAKPNLAEVARAIRQAITEEHEVQIYAVVLIKPGTIPKTSSGKIQRRATRTQFQNDELNIVESDILKISDITRKPTQLQRSELLTLSPRECQPVLKSYLIELLAGVLSIAPDNINPQEPLSTLGLDSLKVFELKNRIEIDLEVEVSVADFFEGMNTLGLVTKLLAQITTAALPSLSLTQIEKNTSIHPLSFAQQGLWFINQLNPDTPTYNIPIVINFKGWINLAALQDSLNEIVRRHEVLRTSFTVVDGQPVQVINQAVPLTLQFEDLRSQSDSYGVSLNTNERTQEAQRLAREFAQQPFDLSAQSLLRTKILQLNEKSYQLLVTLHHIIADGWSIGILIKELAALYEAFSTGKLSLRDATRTPLPELPIQYRDFVNWQRKFLDSERIHRLLTYWKQKLQGELPVLNLPTDRPRQPFTTFNGAQAKLVLSQTLTKELKNLSRQQGVTLFMTLLTAFKTLLYRYTGQTDILVGSPIANRNKAEIDSLIGFFVNVLVLRTDLSDDLSFQELLARVKSTALEAYVHQDLPFEKLVEELQPNRDLSYNPLFQVMFVLQNLPISNPKLSDVAVTYEEDYNGTSKFDITLFMEDSKQGLVATCEYNTDLFNADTITRMLGHLQTLLESIVSDPQQCISDLQLLTPFQVQQLLVEWNDTKTDYPQDKCIHQLFEEQVEKTPNAVAVVFESEQLTYRELNNRANQLAHYLQELGVKPEVLVGICVERSLEMAIGLLAILKAGGAYIPLDPMYPPERLTFMLENANIFVLLTHKCLADKLSEYKGYVICLDTDSEAIAQQSQENQVSGVTPDNLIYAIYTSGSTGKPKGAGVYQRSFTNLLNWFVTEFNLTSSDRVLLISSLSFDLTQKNIYAPLLVGGELHLLSSGCYDAAQIVESVCDKQITWLNCTPSAFYPLIDRGDRSLSMKKTLRYVFLGGEPISISRLKLWLDRVPCKTQIVNTYGPTECTDICAAYRVTQPEQLLEKVVPIGKPIHNAKVYVLDGNLKPLPMGMVGELYVGGEGVGRGYINNLDLTLAKFVCNPFSLKPGAWLYKSGDLARYLSDGNIEFLGRIDNQVKIRGFRIELEEIEVIISQHPAVKASVVVVSEDESGFKRLVAYQVLHPEQSLTVSELRCFLQSKLPNYMIPNALVILEVLPLTPNGKIDRRSLPAPETLDLELEVAYVMPQTQMERTIATVWQDVLHVEKVGVNDNFFEIGGHSLLMVQVNSKLQEVLQRDLSVVEMFQNPTVNSLAQYLNQKQQLSFTGTRDRANKQIEAINRQKQLLSKQNKKNYE
ncbi:MAG: amino acid adenylation domain-containing protein [Nostoc sp.]